MLLLDTHHKIIFKEVILIYKYSSSLTCCDMIPLTRLLKGSISSASPSGVNTVQGCFAMIGLSLGSILMRWATASSSIFPVVTLTFVNFDGEIWSSGFWEMTRRVSGEINVALVVSGAANLGIGAYNALFFSNGFGLDLSKYFVSKSFRTILKSHNFADNP